VASQTTEWLPAVMTLSTRVSTFCPGDIEYVDGHMAGLGDRELSWSWG
jgi:hypothetical protein